MIAGSCRVQSPSGRPRAIGELLTHRIGAESDTLVHQAGHAPGGGHIDEHRPSLGPQCRQPAAERLGAGLRGPAQRHGRLRRRCRRAPPGPPSTRPASGSPLADPAVRSVGLLGWPQHPGGKAEQHQAGGKCFRNSTRAALASLSSDGDLEACVGGILCIASRMHSSAACFHAFNCSSGRCKRFKML